MTRSARQALAAVALAAAGTVAGIGLANAQTDPTTPPTTAVPDDGGAPDAPATPDDRENCPEKDGAGPGRGARSGARSGGATSV